MPNDIKEELYFIHNELEPIMVNGIGAVHMANAFNALENIIMNLEKAEKENKNESKETEGDE